MQCTPTVDACFSAMQTPVVFCSHLQLIEEQRCPTVISQSCQHAVGLTLALWPALLLGACSTRVAAESEADTGAPPCSAAARSASANRAGTRQQRQPQHALQEQTLNLHGSFRWPPCRSVKGPLLPFTAVRLLASITAARGPPQSPERQEGRPLLHELEHPPAPSGAAAAPPQPH